MPLSVAVMGAGAVRYHFGGMLARAGHVACEARPHHSAGTWPALEMPMAKPNIETLAARLDVQAVVLQELARVLMPDQAATVADAVRLRVAELAGHDLSHAADAAVAGELVLLLDALTPR